MHRLTRRLTRPVPCTGLATIHPRPTFVPAFPARKTSAPYATSSPKEAETASAQSGGSRSKDAVEEMSSGADGGAPLAASANPPPRPTILNASVPGTGPPRNLTAEQQAEIDRHNADFEKRPDRAAAAEGDKVDKSFWQGQAGHGNKGDV